MSTRSAKPRILVYAPFSFNGEGPARSCADIVSRLGDRFDIRLFAPRFRASLPTGHMQRPSLPSVFRHIPWRLVNGRGISSLRKSFCDELESVDSTGAIAYFWPDAPIELVIEAKDRGFLTIREMINTTRAAAEPILNSAYSRNCLEPAHKITRESIEAEIHELELYDFVFASNEPVEESLKNVGVESGKILRSTFGWDPVRFACPPVAANRTRPRVLFAGTLCIRKGVPELLRAWERAEVDADLILAGRCDPEVAPLIKAVTSRNVQHLGFVKNVGRLFHGCDFFVSPTLEEGGPQVTYEAAGCRLPVVTTDMGAARLVEDGVNGLIVRPGNVTELAGAIRTLCENADLRRQLGENARIGAEEFTYDRVGRRRAQLLVDALLRSGRRGPQRTTHSGESGV